jgi:hypothetical protein
MGGGGSDKNLGVAALYQAQTQAVLGLQQNALAQQKLDSDTVLQREYMDIIKANQPTEQRLQSAQADAAELALNRYRDVQVPLENQIIDEARNYDSTERIAAEAGKADAAVVQAYDKANAGAQRDMLRAGLNPNSAKALALRENSSLSQAATSANAATSTAEAVKGKGFAMRMDAAGLGRNLPANSTAASDAALRAGQSSAAGMAGLISANNQSFNSTMGGFGQAASTIGGAGNTFQSMAQQQQASSDAKSAGIGKLIGGAASAYAGSAAGSAALTAVGAGLMST